MTTLFKGTYQRGFLSVFFSAGSNPLRLWETHIKDGYICRHLDEELKALVLDLTGVNVSTTYMVCPKGKDSLGIYMPFMVLIVKNLKKYWTFEVSIRDDSGMKRRFRVANFQSATRVNTCNTVMPIGLSDGWNQIQFNLADFTRRAYNRRFMEVVSIKINANIRLRRIYFADRLVPEDELPTEYRLFIPLGRRSKERTSQAKENIPPNPSKEGIEEKKEEQQQYPHEPQMDHSRFPYTSRKKKQEEHHHDTTSKHSHDTKEHELPHHEPSKHAHETQEQSHASQHHVQSKHSHETQEVPQHSQHHVPSKHAHDTRELTQASQHHVPSKHSHETQEHGRESHHAMSKHEPESQLMAVTDGHAPLEVTALSHHEIKTPQSKTSAATMKSSHGMDEQAKDKHQENPELEEVEQQNVEADDGNEIKEEPQ